MNPLMFREYDIRGVADRDLTDEVVRALGQGIGTLILNSGADAWRLGETVDFIRHGFMHRCWPDCWRAVWM